MYLKENLRKFPPCKLITVSWDKSTQRSEKVLKGMTVAIIIIDQKTEFTAVLDRKYSCLLLYLVNSFKNYFIKTLYKSLIYLSCKYKCYLLSCVRLFATPWTVACQAPLSTEVSRQEYWGGLLCSPWDLPKPWIEPRSSSLQEDSLPFELPGQPCVTPAYIKYKSFDFWVIQAKENDFAFGG